jgi:molybdopterin synthase catalytic subunit
VKVRVRLFASFAEIAGFRERELDVPEGATAGDVLAILRRGPLVVLPERSRPLLAVNRHHVAPDQPVVSGDEIAIFPPVSGGNERRAPTALVTAEPLDMASLAAAVRHPACGAVVTFEGVVRDHHEGESVVAVEYEAYAEMAVSVLEALAEEVRERHPRARLALAHRTGLLPVGETSVVVACAAPHRREAFAACRFAMDRIKESLPVWKKEHAAGGDRWITP